LYAYIEKELAGMRIVFVLAAMVVLRSGKCRKQSRRVNLQ
jgi:hypothetical protein